MRLRGIIARVAGKGVRGIQVRNEIAVGNETLFSLVLRLRQGQQPIMTGTGS